MVQICPWDCRRCRQLHCGSLDPSGVVVVCPRHGNPLGYHLPRLAVRSSLSLIQLWALARKR